RGHCGAVRRHFPASASTRYCRYGSPDYFRNFPCHEGSRRMVRGHAVDNAHRQETDFERCTVHRSLRVLDISLPRRRNLSLHESPEGIGRIFPKCPPLLQGVYHGGRSVVCIGCRRWSANCTSATGDAIVPGVHPTSALVDLRNCRRFVSWASRSLSHATSAING